MSSVVGVIVNPISGAGGRADAAQARVNLARRVIESHDGRAEIRVTKSRADAGRLARELSDLRCAPVIAWGGDGTINEIGSALAHSATPLGIVPSGSGNGLARALGVPLEPERALLAALTGVDRRIDAGELDGHLFFNVAGIGLDAHVARLFNEQAEGTRGLWPYVWLSLRALLAYQPASYTITSAGQTFRHDAMLLALANSRQYGLGAVIAPDARLDDGWIDLVVAEGKPSLATLWRARRLFNGTLPRARGIIVHRLEQATIECSTPMDFHVDGEWRPGGTRLDFRVHPGALLVRGNW